LIVQLESSLLAGRSAVQSQENELRMEERFALIDKRFELRTNDQTASLLALTEMTDRTFLLVTVVFENYLIFFLNSPFPIRKVDWTWTLPPNLTILLRGGAWAIQVITMQVRSMRLTRAGRIRATSGDALSEQLGEIIMYSTRKTHYMRPLATAFLSRTLPSNHPP
jgi:hypothetical protein